MKPVSSDFVLPNKACYLPFLSGRYSTSPDLKLSSQSSSPVDKQFFQIDREYPLYFRNKKDCCAEDIGKYYLCAQEHTPTMRVTNQFILDSLLQQHKQVFSFNNNTLSNHLTGETIVFEDNLLNVQDSLYLTAFDALCQQVQEDVAVVQLTPSSDYLMAIHLTAPNHWSPAEKIGRPFDEVHEPVADMEETIKHYRKILDALVRKQQPFTRFAWGMATDDRLNHHPCPPPGVDNSEWQGRAPQAEDEIFVRVERQNILGFAQHNAFIFTIRTYHYAVSSLTPSQQQRLWQAVSSMSPASLKYKGLESWLPHLRQRLNSTEAD